jgi:streptogramin lyase
VLGSEKLYWYSLYETHTEPQENCWQADEEKESSLSCDSVGASYLPNGPHMVEGSVGTDFQIGRSGDYCNYYNLGEGLDTTNENKESGYTGYEPPSPLGDYQEGDHYNPPNVCQAHENIWGQLLRGSGNSNCESVAPCGMQHYVSLGEQGDNDRPWSHSLGEPSLVISADVLPFSKSVSTGAWGYLCPLFEDATTGDILEYCLEEWRVGSGFPSTNEHFDLVADCASPGNPAHNLDQTITQYASGTRFAENLGPESTFVFGSNSSWREFKARITEADLRAAIEMDDKEFKGSNGHPEIGAGCSRGSSPEPKNWALIGVEQGTEGGGLSELGESVANLQLWTEYTPLPPKLSNESVTGVTEDSGTVHATIDPDAQATNYSFEYGETEAFEDAVGGALPDGTGEVSIELQVGFLPHTTYYYRMVVSNAAGTIYGEVHKLRTLGKPYADTKHAIKVGETSATLRGIVNPWGAETEYYFQYGPTTSYGKETKEESAGSGSGNVEVSKEIAGLSVSATYHFRIVARNASGTSYGEDQTITTVPRMTEFSGGSGVHPEQVATGPEGDLWLTAGAANKILRVTPAGEVVKEYSLPSGSWPFAITEGPEGYMWFTETDSNKVGEVNPSTGAIEEFSVGKGEEPRGIVAGPNKEAALWVTALEGEKILKISTSGTISKEYPVASKSEPLFITVGAEGDIYFTETAASKIGRIVPSSGELKEFGLQSNCHPGGIALGPEGDLWYVGSLTGKTVGKITPEGVSTEYSLPAQSYPVAITAAPDGNMWFTMTGTSKVGKISPSTNAITEYTLPTNSHPYRITVDAEGNPWFTDVETDKITKVLFDETTEFAGGSGVHPEQVATGPEGDLWATAGAANKLVRMTPAGEVVKEYSLPSGSWPFAITEGSEGDMYFTETDSNMVGRINPSVGIIEEFSVGKGEEPRGIVAGPNKEAAVWVAALEGGKILKFSTTSAAVSKEYSVASKSEPMFVTVGAEGDIYFTETAASKVGKIVPSSGEVKEFGLQSNCHPGGIALGPEGDLWYVGSLTGKTVGKITPEGVSTEYSLPAQSYPLAITAAPDGNMWFTMDGTSKVGKITPSTGAITEYIQPTNSHPYGITVDAEGNLWYTDVETDKITKLTPIEPGGLAALGC